MRDAGGVVYLDNAATSFPKPPAVARAVAEFLTSVGASPGRSAHRLAVESARRVFDARQHIADFLGVGESRRVIFALNATHALNLALMGTIRRRDHVVITSMEHNSVTRPLRRLMEARDVEVSRAESDRFGKVSPESVSEAVRPTTRMVVCNHASNVTGSLQDIAAIREAAGDALLLVDAAQTAGATPIDMSELGVDLLAFTGHKSLLGPQGTGGLCLSERVEPEPIVFGGTGSRSESDEQPEFLPDRYESGTQNGPGLSGLAAGLRWLVDHGGAADARRKEMDLFSRLWEGLSRVERVVTYGPASPEERVAVVSFNIAGVSPSKLGALLDRRYGVACRVGLHCAPEAHRSIGTFPEGAVRLSPGPFTTRDDIDLVVRAVGELSEEPA